MEKTNEMNIEKEKESHLSKKIKYSDKKENDKHTISLNNFIPLEKLKYVFPSIIDEKLKEAVEKGNNNIERAIEIIREMIRTESKSQDKKTYRNKRNFKNSLIKEQSDQNENSSYERTYFNIINIKENKPKQQRNLEVQIEESKEIEEAATQENEVKNEQNEIAIDNQINQIDQSAIKEEDDAYKDEASSIEKDPVIEAFVDKMMGHLDDIKSKDELHSYLMNNILFKPIPQGDIDDKKKEISSLLRESINMKSMIGAKYKELEKVKKENEKGEKLFYELLSTIGNLLEVRTDQKIKNTRTYEKIKTLLTNAYVDEIQREGESK